MVVHTLGEDAGVPSRMLSLINAEPYERLMDRDGQSLWPVTSSAEVELLRALATQFHGEVVIETASAVAVAGRRQSTCVVALGERSRDAARLYAHLTDRDFEEVSSAVDIATMSRCDVVVAILDDCDEDVYRALVGASERSDVLPGLVCGANEVQLRCNVLLAAAALHLSKSAAEARRVDFLPRYPIARIALDARSLVGGRGSPEEVHDALAGPNGLLTIIDADFGPLILCPINAARHAQNGYGRAPTCVRSSFCHRIGVSLSHANDHPLIIRPSSLRARVLLLNSCFAAPLGNAEVYSSWGLISSLLGQSAIGAIIAPLGSTFATGADLETVGDQLDSGEAIGLVARRLWRDGDTSGRTRSFLFGDPRVRLRQSVSHSQRRGSLAQRSKGLEQRQQFPSFMEALVEACAARDDGSRSELISRCRVSLLASRDSRSDNFGDIARPECLDAVLDLVESFGTMPSRQWLSNSTAPSLEEDEAVVQCVRCARVTVIYSCEVACRHGQRRRLVSCPECGIIADAPWSQSEIPLRISNNAIEVRMSQLSNDEVMRVLVEPRYSGGVAYASMSDQDIRQTAGRISLAHLPTGLSFVALLIVSTTNLRAYRFPVWCAKSAPASVKEFHVLQPTS